VRSSPLQYVDCPDATDEDRYGGRYILESSEGHGPVNSRIISPTSEPDPEQDTDQNQEQVE
jgi:hypothetical protein